MTVEFKNTTPVTGGLSSSTVLFGAVDGASDSAPELIDIDAVADYIGGGDPASETAAGIVELATNAETVTGTDTARAVTPANLTAKMSAPGAIGNTTPGTGAFQTLSATGAISALGGQVAFPATQNPSSDANTLDDYEEGTWTPVLTFATPGNLSVAYTLQSGFYTKVGRLLAGSGGVLTSAFTHTTASGNCQLTGLPFAAANFNNANVGNTSWEGITKAGYTQVGAFITGTATLIIFAAFASGAAVSLVTASDMPTGGTVQLQSSLTYPV